MDKSFSQKNKKKKTRVSQTSLHMRLQQTVVSKVSLTWPAGQKQPST
jgi:hypothetical protein